MENDNKNKNKNKGDVTRFLRWVNIWAWLPAFPFLLAHGIVSHDAVPAVGIAPMTISAVVAAVHLYFGVKVRAVSIAVDVSIAAFLIGVLIPGWVQVAEEGGRWWYDSGLVMVHAYGTAPMMLNFVIHSWFVLRETYMHLFGGLLALARRPQRCPHCFGDVRRPKQLDPHSHQSSDGKEAYQAVGTIDPESASPVQGPSYTDYDAKAPRPSTDDESACLV